MRISDAVVAKREAEARAYSEEFEHPGGGEVITQQQFAEETDINVIVQRFGLTGVLPQQVTAGVYGDFSGISDYDSAVETIELVRERFMRLPAAMREKFGNDPGALVAFASSHSEEDLVSVFGDGSEPLEKSVAVEPPADGPN